MITNIITIGNSSGIRIPKVLLEESGLGKDVELKVKKGEIKIVPATNNRNNDPNLLLSEKVLSVDWTKKEEDEAWKNLK